MAESASTTQPPPISSPPVNQRQTSHGPIIGGVVAGGVILTLVIIGFVFYKRRKRNRAGHLSPLQRQQNLPPPMSNASSVLNSTRPSPIPNAVKHSRNKKAQLHTTYPAVPASSSSAPTPASKNESRVREVDAGSIREEAEDEERTLPPDYDDATRNRRTNA